MKKAFTLSEALITLAIIGVLAAILIPVISNVRPDKDRIHYKKALYSLQSAVSNAMDATEYSMAANSSAYWADPSFQNKPEAFCEAIADALNISGKANCKGPYPNCEPTSSSCYKSPNFITTDGIRYWNLEGTFDLNTHKTRTIMVDRNIGTQELKSLARIRNTADPGLKIQVRYDGKVGTEIDENSSEDFSYENELTEQSLQVTAGKQAN